MGQGQVSGGVSVLCWLVVLSDAYSSWSLFDVKRSTASTERVYVNITWQSAPLQGYTPTRWRCLHCCKQVFVSNSWIYTYSTRWETGYGKTVNNYRSKTHVFFWKQNRESTKGKTVKNHAVSMQKRSVWPFTPVNIEITPPEEILSAVVWDIGSILTVELHIAENAGNYKFWMLILVKLWEHERQRWDASRYTWKRFSTIRTFMYCDASHLWRSCSHNMAKITIQFLNIIVKLNYGQAFFILPFLTLSLLTWGHVGP